MTLPRVIRLALAAFAVATTLGFVEPCVASGTLVSAYRPPVQQTAERVLFSINDDQTVTAVLEVRFEEHAAPFAWVLPVPSSTRTTIRQVGWTHLAR